MAKKPDKNKILMQGASMHLIAYVAIALVLSLLNVPGIIIFATMMVLLWGLVVLSYAFYYEK